MAKTKYQVLIEPSADEPFPTRWRVEVWRQPYIGEMVAWTRWVKSRGQARRDAKRWIRGKVTD